VVFRSITTVGCRPGPAGSTPRRAREPGGRTLGHAGQARRGGLGSGLGARLRALHSLATSHHAGRALRRPSWPHRRGAPSWPRQAAEPVPRRSRAHAGAARSRRSRARAGAAPAPPASGRQGRRGRRGRALVEAEAEPLSPQGGAELAAPDRRAGAAPKPRPRRGRALAQGPCHPRRAAGATGAEPLSRLRLGEGGRGRTASRERERDVRGIGEGEKEVGERGWG
jgi:hypothetical protein